MFGQAMQSSQSNFTIPPFPPFPAASRYVALGSVEEAIARVSNSIRGGDGIALIMGPPGTGKSIICSVLAKEHAESHLVVSLGDVAITNQDSFYRRLLHEMGVDVTAIPAGDMEFAVVQQVCSDDAPAGGVLLLIDEAQVMPAEVLEAIRATTNIMKDGQPRVSAVICGGPKLDETLASASMEPFSQRVATRCYLHPLNSQETRFYITEVIRTCGSNPDSTITDEAIGAIHHASNGIPRLINQMMTEAIDCAADENETVICERIVDQAWAQLQQLPSPIVEEQKIASDSAPVEFGLLDDSIEFGEMSTDVAEPHQTAEEKPAAEEHAVEEPGVRQPNAQPAIAMDELAFAEEPSAAPIENPIRDVPRESIVVRNEIQSAEIACEGQTESSQVCDDAFTQLRLSQPLPGSIFGEFEQEEPVSVDQPSDHIVIPQSDEVEMRLQADVLQLREMATQARYGGADESNIAGDMFDVPDEPLICEAPIWLDESENAGDFELNSNANDDSDLLIIEDEVDVVPKSLQQPSGAKGQTMKVDYQQMLASMRSGN